MSWAQNYIQQLQNNKIVSFRPKGNSMLPKIKSGQLCTVTPINEDTILQEGDVVLCKVRGRDYLHLITTARKNQFQISNNKGHINGWITKNAIFGKLIKIED
jgi:hypothetical protein